MRAGIPEPSVGGEVHEPPGLACHEWYHVPVMASQVVSLLVPGEDKLLVDCTLGDGGHSEAWLRAGGRVLALDRDPEAVARARRRLARWGERFQAHQARFSQLEGLVGELRPDAVLFDLGTSTHQLRDPARGFSYLQDGPLDMRMDPSSGEPLREVLPSTDAQTLREWLRAWGDVPKAGKVAALILARKPQTTGELASLVRSLFPPPLHTKVLSCVFQALRMAVNQEVEELRGGLEAAVRVVQPGGRIAVLTYHSGEARVVKAFLRRQRGDCVCPPGLPVCGCQPVRRMRVVAWGLAPAASEVGENPQARSARLWVGERLHG